MPPHAGEDALAAVEQMLRWLLALPRRPAVVFVHFFSMWEDCAVRGGAGKSWERAAGAAAAAAPRQRRGGMLKGRAAKVAT